MRHRKKIVLIAILFVMALVFITCMDNSRQDKDPRGGLYAGSAACIGCHKEVVNSFSHTSHFKTSSRASAQWLDSILKTGNTVAHYPYNSLVRVEKRGDGFFQSYIKEGAEIRAAGMDIAIGSGEKAQTYAYWKNEQLFQLPLTYFAGSGTWTNSPGYPIAQPYFDRVILSRCLECHASYVFKTDVQTGPLEVSEKLDAGSIVFGIDCERCHGPAAEHAKFQQENPSLKQARFITSIASLTRQQQLDVCGACHSGNDLDVQRTLFTFRPGDTLQNYYYPHFGMGKPNPDVHGKQMQLLGQSKCFRLSEMTCGSCHSPHRQDDMNVFVTKCMNCHTGSRHAASYRTQATACINCHMPLQESRVLDFNDGKEQKSIPYMLRTHRIAVYPASK